MATFKELMSQTRVKGLKDAQPSIERIEERPGADCVHQLVVGGYRA